MLKQGNILKFDFLASFDVDAQQCFTPLCPKELPVPSGNEIVDELNLQAQFARVRLGSKDAHSPQALWVTKDLAEITKSLPKEALTKHKNLDIYWPEHAVPGTKGFELIPGLPRPCDYDYFVWKGVELDMHPYGACYHDLRDKMSTGVIEYLTCQKISYVIVGGLCLEHCVKATILQLMKAGFRVILNLAATRELDSDLGQQAKDKMQSLGVIFVENSSQIVNILG